MAPDSDGLAMGRSRWRPALIAPWASRSQSDLLCGQSVRNQGAPSDRPSRWQSLCSPSPCLATDPKRARGGRLLGIASQSRWASASRCCSISPCWGESQILMWVRDPAEDGACRYGDSLAAGRRSVSCSSLPTPTGRRSRRFVARLAAWRRPAERSRSGSPPCTRAPGRSASALARRRERRSRRVSSWPAACSAPRRRLARARAIVARQRPRGRPLTCTAIRRDRGVAACGGRG